MVVVGLRTKVILVAILADVHVTEGLMD